MDQKGTDLKFSKDLIRRLRVRLKSVSAIQNAGLDYSQPLLADWGYDYQLKEEQSDSLEFMDLVKSEYEPKIVNSRRRKKDVLREIPIFYLNNLGVTVKCGQEYAKIKFAALKLDTKLLDLRSDMDHFRFLYNERKTSEKICGTIQLFQRPLNESELSKFALDYPSLTFENLPKITLRNQKLEKLLQHLPELWKTYNDSVKAELQKHQMLRRLQSK